MNFQKGKKNEEFEINFIPLIDVLLVIIIFLVVSTTFSRFSEIKINLPSANAQPAEKQDFVINVTVTKDGKYAVNEEAIDADNISGIAVILDKISNKNLDTPVVINADAKATHQSVINVMEASRQVGLTKITFTTKVN
jgi:biopolymer transport protein ExbD|tara:strand:+ start:219 stop:632 length:414 start_codon:yes stop_codon:yes gene_type:complete